MGFWRGILIIFLPFASGFFFTYFFRVINAVIAPDLESDIGLTAGELGLLSAAYFLTFAASQIPLGLLLDRYGPRRVQGSLFCLAGFGSFLFAVGESFLVLLFARALVGVGVSGGLMAAFKATVQWFPREKYALINGWFFAAGALGAVTATAPVELALEYLNWRGLFVFLAVATFGSGGMILLVVPDKPDSLISTSLRQQAAAIVAIFRNVFFWRIVPLHITCHSAYMAIQGLWAGPWLSDVARFDDATVASHLFAMAVAMLIGVSLSGVFASALQRLGLSLDGVCGIGAVLNIGIMAAVSFQLTNATYVLWSLVGLFGIMTTVVFAALASHFPQTHVGRAHTAANVLVFSMAFAYQFGIGAIVELWPANPDGSYPATAYTVAFLITTGTQILALFWYLISPKTANR